MREESIRRAQPLVEVAAYREELLAGEVFGPVDAGVGLGLQDRLLDDALPGRVVD